MKRTNKLLFLVHTICSLIRILKCMEESDLEMYTNTFAIQLHDNDIDLANQIAKKHNLKNMGKVIPGYFTLASFKNHSTQELQRVRRRLKKDPKIKWLEHQQVLEREKRSIVPDYVNTIHPTGFSVRDPLYKDQWYLNNLGQSNGPVGLDINILPVWARGISGRGVVVAVLDDGLDHTHPDLKTNYDARASYDFNDYDNDPMPRSKDPNNCHGTKCAGEIAAEANNGICGVGVAFNASIGGIRMLDGNTTDTIEGSALSFHNNYIHIYSCAWGPKDDGKRFGRPGTLASKALELGVKEGRSGLGSIFVWATGNGGLTDDDCNADGYTTSVYTVSIGAISDHGLSTYYTESCASTLAVTYSGGSHREKSENKIVTTTLNHKCTEEFKGTSSAAPLATGMVALMLETNPKLTWRDIQHLIVETSVMTSPLDEGWRRNGVGKWFNQKFGFGRMDTSALVEKAVGWENVGEQKTCWSDKNAGPWDIPDSGTLMVAVNSTACAGTLSDIKVLEHVQVVISLKHRRRGHLDIALISPSGTRTQLLKTRRNDKSTKGLKDWVFMSVHFWGEDPKGEWTLAITDNNNNNRKHHNEKIKFGDLEDATQAFQHEMNKDKSDSKTTTSPSDTSSTVDRKFKSTEDFEDNIFKDSTYHAAKNVPKKKNQQQNGRHHHLAHNVEKTTENLLKLKLPKMTKHNKKKSQRAQVVSSVNNPDASYVGAPKGSPTTDSFKAKNSDSPQIQLQSQHPSLLNPPTVKSDSPGKLLNISGNFTDSVKHVLPFSNSSLDTNIDVNSNANTVQNQNNPFNESRLEEILKNTMSEFLLKHGGASSPLAIETRISDLERILTNTSAHDRNTTDESANKMTSSLIYALQKGKPIEKLNNVLTMIGDIKSNSSTNATSSNTEVITDVLKVLRDILDNHSDDKSVTPYKDRISYLLEASSNKTHELTTKLFNDIDPIDNSSQKIVLNDALALISNIFSQQKQNGKQGIDGTKVKYNHGNLVSSYSGKGDKLKFDKSLDGKVVMTTTALKEIHHKNGNVETVKVEHINIGNKDGTPTDLTFAQPALEVQKELEESKKVEPAKQISEVPPSGINQDYLEDEDHQNDMRAQSNPTERLRITNDDKNDPATTASVLKKLDKILSESKDTKESQEETTTKKIAEKTALEKSIEKALESVKKTDDSSDITIEVMKNGKVFSKKLVGKSGETTALLDPALKVDRKSKKIQTIMHDGALAKEDRGGRPILNMQDENNPGTPSLSEREGRPILDEHDDGQIESESHSTDSNDKELLIRKNLNLPNLYSRDDVDSNSKETDKTDSNDKDVNNIDVEVMFGPTSNQKSSLESPRAMNNMKGNMPTAHRHTDSQTPTVVQILAEPTEEIIQTDSSESLHHSRSDMDVTKFGSDNDDLQYGNSNSLGDKKHTLHVSPKILRVQVGKKKSHAEGSHNDRNEIKEKGIRNKSHLKHSKSEHKIEYFYAPVNHQTDQYYEENLGHKAQDLLSVFARPPELQMFYAPVSQNNHHNTVTNEPVRKSDQRSFPQPEKHTAQGNYAENYAKRTAYRFDKSRKAHALDTYSKRDIILKEDEGDNVDSAIGEGETENYSGDEENAQYHSKLSFRKHHFSNAKTSDLVKANVIFNDASRESFPSQPTHKYATGRNSKQLIPDKTSSKMVESIVSYMKLRADDSGDRRSAIKRAQSLEQKLKIKLLSLKQGSERSSVLGIIKRVHDDITSGNPTDLRTLENELSQMVPERSSDNIIIDPMPRKHEIIKSFAKIDSRNDPESTLIDTDKGIEEKNDATNEINDDQNWRSSKDIEDNETLRQRVERKPIKYSDNEEDLTDNPDEMYRYGVSASGELVSWTILFYGTGGS